ncbi:MAG TPA: TonB-dependent receptor [Pyrinomonadaceae bacterium]|nr:TonB-dependent receptor [Pyrinomonadaceae bacterium]
MSWSLYRWYRASMRVLLACVTVLLVVSAAMAQAQSNAGDLQGTVRDPNGAAVPNASITARNTGTNIAREATSNDDGNYKIVNLPPGDYEVTVKASSYKTAIIPSVKVTIGQTINQDIPLELGELSATVTVTSVAPTLVETTNTTISSVVDQQRIENLPINERNYLSFALTTSTVGRDNGRPIGPAPTTGLNFGGQRGRSNLVQVDGADNTDNSVNASRSTVSQEAVQEFQVVTNSFAPEFGRSAGGVVNVVTKSGTNEFHGNAFGFLRHRSFQARNAFAPVSDPPFTRAQYGGTIGGHFDKGEEVNGTKQYRSFFFFAFEQRQRHESGFFTSNVRAGLNSSVTIGAPFLPFTQTFSNITARQSAYVNTLLSTATTLIGTGVPANIAQGQALAGAAVQYAALASSGGVTAITGSNPLLSVGGAIPAGTTIGPRFFLTGAPVPSGTTNAAGQFIAFRPLQALQTVFPVTDKTTFNSFRLDHVITKNHHLTFRFGYNPSTITGIQVESQNQSLGQNDFSRTGIQVLKDYSAVTSLNSTLSNRMVNEFRYNFGERRAIFKSQNGDAVAFNISGTAFIGRELFSPVVRTETRHEFTDNLNVVWGAHTFKFGGDYAAVNIPSAVFELNFAGLFNFGGLSATTLAAFPTVGTAAPPDFTPVQQYGLGIPSNFIQGYGNPVSQLNNKPIAFFAQDSWKIGRHLNVNYGIRYDYEITQQIPAVGFRDPLSGIALSAADILAAQDAVGVQQGFPRDKNNWAPRVGFAWDIMGDQKTVLRGAAGIFYDHPLLAIGFNSDIADAAQQQQGVFITGSPSPTALLNASQIFQGTVCSGTASGAANPFCLGAGLPASFVTPGVAAGAQYQFGRQRFNDQTFPGFGPVLPFTLPVQKNFEYAYANQANLTFERQLTTDMAVSASYLFVGAHHLPHPLDINAPRTDLQIANFARYANRNPTSTTEALLVSGTCPGPTCFFPSNIAAGATFANPLLTGDTLVNIVPGMIVFSPTRGRIISPAIANFFRPNAPNYFLAQAASGGLVTKAVLDSQLAGTLRSVGVISPFGSINAQTSDGNSTYHALNVDLKKRFSRNFQFLASYTWSHSIDDSSDLQTLLLPQDNRNFRAEKANALFDQRHRFVFSGVLASPGGWRSGDGWHQFLSDFTLSPIFEISSGRPFNILSNQDTNNDQSNQTDRPSVLSDGTLCVPGSTGCAPLITNGVFSSGSLGRNMGITHRYMSLDMRLARAVRIGERLKLDIIAEGFNLFNRFNEGAASPFIDDVNAFGQRSGSHYYSRPTAAFDSRQFQFGLKLNF